MNIAITGRSGRMGLAVAEAVNSHPGASIHGTHDTGEDLGSASDCSVYPLRQHGHPRLIATRLQG